MPDTTATLTPETIYVPKELIGGIIRKFAHADNLYEVDSRTSSHVRIKVGDKIAAIYLDHLNEVVNGADPTPVEVTTPLSTPYNAIQTTVDILMNLGFSVLPVAPYQDPHRYPLKDKGVIKYEKDGVTPKPRFLGKNPSYLDAHGVPYIITSGDYKDIQPTQEELSKWWLHPANGVGTLCTNTQVWIDIDVKNFDSQEDCDRQFNEWREKHPQLKDAWIESTGSGGYHILVKLKVPKSSEGDFTKFSFSEGGKLVGEVQGYGQFIVMAPTQGTAEGQHNDYEIIDNFEAVVEVESLSSIDIYAYSKSKATNAAKGVNSPVKVHQTPCVVVGSINLDECYTTSVWGLLNGEEVTDRSESFTKVAREIYGWGNFLTSNSIGFTPTVEVEIARAVKAINIDDKWDRVIDTIDTANCVPACLSYGEAGAWKKIRKLDESVYDDRCPQRVREKVESDLALLTAKSPIGGSVESIAPELLDLRIAPDNKQGMDFWVNPKGPLYKLLTRDDVAIRSNIRNGNVTAYKLISTQIGAIYGPKLTCKMKVGGITVEQRGGGHALVIGVTGDGKTAISTAIKAISGGILGYSVYQAEMVSHIANSMVCHIERLVKVKGSDDESKASLSGELLIAKQFQRAVREGGQCAFLTGGNAVAFSAHSAHSVTVYRGSAKFWALYQDYQYDMHNFGAWYPLTELHNPGLLMYNRDAIAEIEKFAGTEFASSGSAIGLLLAGFSTEDTNSYSRGNSAGTGSGNAINTQTRFSIVALTQPSVRKGFISKDIAMGSSKYGMAPRIDFLHIHNTDNTDSSTFAKAQGLDDLDEYSQSSSGGGSSDTANPVTVAVQEALQRIGTAIMSTTVKGCDTLAVRVTSDAAVIYDEFTQWVTEIDPNPPRYNLDRHPKLPQHFTKICLNAWLVDLVDECLGKMQDEVSAIFLDNIRKGITTMQAERATTLMKLHYVEHMIDGNGASSLSSIDGEDAIEGVIKDEDTVKAICENKNTLLQWYESVAERYPGKPQSKVIELGITKKMRDWFQGLTGNTLSHYVKQAKSGKHLNLDLT
jgi:hypothetical protein